MSAILSQEEIDAKMPLAPHVAIVLNELQYRPSSFGALPYEVSHEIFQAAKIELAMILQSRGYPLIAADIGRDNFLLCGIPICPAVLH